MSATSTLHHVATLAGVSKTTASLILNNRQLDQFSPQTRQRVLQTARELRYRPRARRRATAEAAVKNVAFVLSEKLGPVSDRGGYFGSVLDGLQEAAGQRGIHVTVGTNLATAEDQRAFLDDLREVRLDGVVTGSALEPEVLRELSAWRLPVVCAGDVSLCANNGHQVHGNNYEGGRLATRHLLDLGHRRIAYVGFLSQRPFFVQRMAGYLSALLEAGEAPDPALTWRPASETQVVEAIARGLEARPTAIFAGSSELTLRTLDELHRRGMTVPDQISLVGYDDWAAFATANPPITTLAVCPEQVGSLALSRLLSLANELDAVTPPHLALLEPRLILRQSTRALAV